MFFSLAIFVLCFIAALTTTQIPTVDEHMMEECLKETSVTLDELKALKPRTDVPEKVLCLYKCISVKTGVIDANGKIDLEKVKFTPDIAELEEPKKTQAIECAKKIDKIEKCTDLKKFNECLEASG